MTITTEILRRCAYWDSRYNEVQNALSFPYMNKIKQCGIKHAALRPI